MKDLFIFGKTLHSKIGSSAKSGAQTAGKSYPQISSWWKGKTGKSIDTSKADILIGKKQVSVKKSKAQLMSGERKESLATLEAAFAESTYVYEGTFTNAGYPHMSMEPRSALAYWENGKLYLHGGSQSLTAFADGIAGIIGVPKADLVFINEATGGGFGQRARAGSVPVYAVPAKLSQKINRPVMMRATREEEFTIGGARQGLTGWIKVGFKPDGVMAACDLWIVSDNGGKGGGADAFSAADCISVLYQTDAVRFRGTAIGTNTAHRGAQRGPGQNQIAPIISPIMDVAADELGVSRFDIRKINTPMTGDVGGPQRIPFTSAYMPEALEMAREQFGWDERQSRRRQQNGSKVVGLGIGQGYHNAGRSGMDGIVMMGWNTIWFIYCTRNDYAYNFNSSFIKCIICNLFSKIYFYYL